MVKKYKLLIALMVLILTLAGCSSIPAETPAGTGDLFDLLFLNGNGEEYIVSLKLPSAARSIAGSGHYVDRLPGLKTVSIPNSVTTIEQNAFIGCTSLASVTFEGTIPSSGFNASSPFLGDLRVKFYAANPANGTPGTYTTTAPVSGNSVWTKQP